VDSFLLYFTNKSPLQDSDILEKGSVSLGAADSRNRRLKNALNRSYAAFLAAAALSRS
tara:strand:- start:6345 stop:6518 length:174 start_codon:yes stop_codon:yes gene_type:complete